MGLFEKGNTKFANPLLKSTTDGWFSVLINLQYYRR